MSMPHPKMLFATGCVVQVKPTKDVVIYRSEAEIKTLHPYFAIGTNAADIVAQTATVSPKAKNNEPHLTHKSVKVKSRHVILRIKKGMTKPKAVSGPHPMKPTYFYWLVKR
jgi:hypothetical protein